MGISASDAGPPPRLGEIFFDVRGSSRSMRLSWHSNTGIAVFSIWQGGTCTGTFRLPVDDLNRLVDSLRRGTPVGQDENSGPIALGGQRPRLAIGAAPAEPFTGMMTTLTDERAAYGRPNGRQTGGFAAAGADSPRNGYRNGAGQPSLGDYVTGAQSGGAADRYSTGPHYNGNESRYNANGSEYTNGSGRQYDSPDQYGTADRHGAGSQQYGQYGIRSGGDGQSRPGSGGQAGEQRADYQYGAAQSGAQYAGGPGYGEAGYGEASYADTGSAGLARQGGQPGAGFTYQSGGGSGAPEASHGDETGPRPAVRYTDQAGYGQSGAQSFEAQSFEVPGFGAQGVGARSYESRQQESPSSAAESYDQPYGGQGYGQQQAYQQPSYDDQGYDDQGYAAPGRAEQAPAGAQFAAGSFGNSGYNTPGQQDVGSAPGGQAQYQEYGYGQRDQRDTTAQARDQQGFATQQPTGGPQQWQDVARTAQPATAQGYQADSGGISAPSAPLPDNGAGQQPPSAAQAQGATAYPGQPGGSYGAQAPESDRYAASYGEQQGYPESPGYQAQSAQPDAARYQGAASVGAGNGAGAAVTPDYAGGTSAQGYRSAADMAGSRGYDQPGYNGSGNAGGYGEGDRGGAGSFPAGYSATSAPGTGAYAEAAGADGYAAGGYASNGYGTSGYGTNGYGTSGYGTNEYQANGYAAGGSGADHPSARVAGQGSAPSGAYPQVSANGYAQDAPRPAAQPTFTPTFTAHGGADSPAQAGGTGRPNQSVGAGYAQAQGYGTSPADGGAQAYQAAQAYQNGNGAGYQAPNGNAYAAPNGNAYAAPNGNAYAAANGNAYAVANGNGYAPLNGSDAGYQAANGNGYAAANGNGYAAPNGTAQAGGYQRDGYPSGQSTGPAGVSYQPAPGYTQADQTDQAQQGYWDQEQQPRGNWT